MVGIKKMPTLLVLLTIAFNILKNQGVSGRLSRALVAAYGNMLYRLTQEAEERLRGEPAERFFRKAA